MPTSVNLGDIAQVISEQNKFASVLSLSCKDRENWCKINGTTLASCRDAEFKAEHIRRCKIEHGSDMYEALKPHLVSGLQGMFYINDLFELFRTESLYLEPTDNLVLPSEIKFLKSLQKLTVRRKHFLAGHYKLEIPPEIGQLEGLRTLHVSGCKLSSLPVDVALLRQLSTLDLSKNPLNEFPAVIMEVASLTKLSLKRCGLSEIPDQITRLTNLKELYISKNEFTEFPLVVTELLGLNALSLSGNYILKVPHEISRLSNLKDLRLAGRATQDVEGQLFTEPLGEEANFLTELPDSIGELTRLERFDFHTQRLRELPFWIENLTELMFLNLQNCMLGSGSQSLEKLRNLTSLFDLDLGRNALDFLSPEVGSLRKLRILNVNHNLLTSLPSTFSNLTLLSMVSLDDNEFVGQPPELTALIALAQSKGKTLEEY